MNYLYKFRPKNEIMNHKGKKRIKTIDNVNVENIGVKKQ